MVQQYCSITIEQTVARKRYNGCVSSNRCFNDIQTREMITQTHNINAKFCNRMASTTRLYQLYSFSRTHSSWRFGDLEKQALFNFIVLTLKKGIYNATKLHINIHKQQVINDMKHLLYEEIQCKA